MTSIDASASYRIGAVSKLANVPVTTLRIWETRYQAFRPTKTSGQHRLYGQDDVLRATLFKQLGEQGHAISQIAALSSAQLQFLHAQGLSASALRKHTKKAEPLRAWIVGPGLAQRLKSMRQALGLFAEHNDRAQLFLDLEQARVAAKGARTDLLLIRLNTIHETTVSEIIEVAQASGATHTLVLYVYAAGSNLQKLSLAGLTVHKDAVSDLELSQWLRNISLEQTLHTSPQSPATSPVTPKKYSDETLARVANISTAVMCECPRHVAELLGQLSSFEQYSQECINKNSADQLLHKHLAEVSGQARALFEHALELIAAHEGISLER